MDELLAYIHSLTEFSEQDWHALEPVLSEVEFKKNAYLLEAGKTADALFFIRKGCCRAFYLVEEKEINTSFFFEGDIATNINSFAGGSLSEFSIQACEDTLAIRFDRQKLREAAMLHPNLESLGRKCLARIAAAQERHAVLYQLLSPEERYGYLEEQAPEMLRRLPLYLLASYLGVARETLSRIRRRRFKRTL